MNKTMLTYRTLDRFENEYVTENYTDAEIGKIEFDAYVANMNECAHPEWTENDIFCDFLRVLKIEKIDVQRRKYDVKVTIGNGYTIARYGMPKDWCERIIVDDLLPQYEGEGATIEIIERR